MKRILLSLFLVMITGTVIFLGESCKKLDFTRYPAVTTQNATGVSGTSATANGAIIDLGDNNMVNYGFCWSTAPAPDISDSRVKLGVSSNLGPYSSLITNLQQNTTYYLRAFTETAEEVFYGSVVSFKTQYLSGSTWLHYDDGVNFDGIGVIDGGSWDYAIRFPKEDLGQYNGLRISRIKFFPIIGDPVHYSLTIWTGNEPPDLVHIQDITNPVINSYNDVNVSTTIYVDASQDLWIGCWVQDQPANQYPAGVDDGPAIDNLGDLISFDDGDSWQSLHGLNISLNYNWNLQVYVTDTKGQETEIAHPSNSAAQRKEAAMKNQRSTSGTSKEISSKSLNEQSK